MKSVKLLKEFSGYKAGTLIPFECTLGGYHLFEYDKKEKIDIVFNDKFAKKNSKWFGIVR